MVSVWRDDALRRCVCEGGGGCRGGGASRPQVLVAGFIGGVCEVLDETGEIAYDEKSMGRNVQALRIIRGYIPVDLKRLWCGLLWVARCNNEGRMG